jgi:hypothetical protein
VEIVLLDLGLFKESPLPQGTGGILAPQEFPLGDGIAQQFRVMEFSSFAGEQVGHGGNAAGCIGRGGITVIDGSVRVEGTFILGWRALSVWSCFQAALNRGGASEFDLALVMGDGGLNPHRAEHEYAQAQRRKASRSASAGRESMAEEKRHVSELQTTRQSLFSIDFPVGEAKEKPTRTEPWERAL